MFTIQPTGTTTIANLNQSSCDVKATTGGDLYCGTDANTGGGDSAWTILSGVIHNATSTDEVGIGTATPTSTLHIQGNGTTPLLTVSTSTGGTILQVNVDGTTSFGGNANPVTSDGASLGTSDLKWSDLFLDAGGVINFNSGDVTITHNTGQLLFAGASIGYTFDADITVTGSIYPQSDSSYNLGSSGFDFGIIYTENIDSDDSAIIWWDSLDSRATNDIITGTNQHFAIEPSSQKAVR